jgi:hypothetical protein
MPGKLKKFCQLSKYVKSVDKDLYQALDDLCLLTLFNTRNRGVTFLFPADKSYRKKIVNMAYSNTPEKAVDMFKALLISDYLPSCSDFGKKQDDIPNFLRKKLEIVSATDKEVKLKSGHKLELEKAYIPLRNGDQAAVYKLTGKGELPTTGAASTGKYTQQTTNGGYSGGVDNKLRGMTKFVEKKFCQGDNEAYKKILAVVYKHALGKSKMYYPMLCATEIATFYHILQPYKSTTTVEPDLVVKINALCQGWEKCDSKAFEEKWEENRNELIKAGRGGQGVVDMNQWNGKYKQQKEILSSSVNVSDYKSEIDKSYLNTNSGNTELNKDLLSVYCYLSIIQDDYDRDYFKNCFCPAMEFVFNDNSIQTRSTDIAGSITLYGNLLKSDAFRYIPTLSKERLQFNGENKFEDLKGKLPSPLDNNNLFTIEKNSVKEKRGGGVDVNTLA